MLLAAICLAIPVIVGYWRLFFGNLKDFSQDLEDAAYPDWIAFLRGRFWEGEWVELKLLWFVIITVGLVAAFYVIGVKTFY